MTDFGRLLAALASHDVRYIIVGGFAATAHGSAFLTVDLDVVYERAPANIGRLVAALEPLSRPRALIAWPYYQSGLGRTYDVSRPDGDRFLAIRTAGAGSDGAPPQPQVEVVLDWFGVLEERLPRA